MINTSLQNLNITVIEGGYCIGCGACASLNNSPITIEFDEFKKYKAVIKNFNTTETTDFEAVCPFSNKSENENEIGKQIFPNNTFNEKLGFVKGTYVGYVKERDYRENGSSGGIGTWILSELLRNRMVDKIIHVKNSTNSSEGKLYQYQISGSIDEIKNGSKTKYYPIELSEVIKLIKHNKDESYAIVGVPCFIKAIRLLMKKDTDLNIKIKYCIGLVCGHLKSANFANMWSWQVGIHPNELVDFNFRNKIEGEKANNYGITATTIINNQITTIDSPPLNKLFGGNWGWGLFKYKACDYCDDVVAETADITIGDAWLPQFVNDSLGTNIVITRNNEIDNLLKKAQLEGKISLDSVSTNEIIKSQKSGFSHRRESLAYRLYLTDQERIWRPKKRIQASSKQINRKIKQRQKLRIKLASKSHIAFNEALDTNSFQTFKDKLNPLIIQYNKLYKPSIYDRIIYKIKKIIYS